MDASVRLRQICACVATLVLPVGIAFFTRMAGQGLHMTILGAIVSTTLVLSIFVAGRRRSRGQ